MDHNIHSQRDGNTRPPYLLLRNLYAGQEATVRTGHGTKDWERSSKLGKEYIKGVYRHPNYLTYIQSISCEMLGWMNHELDESQARIKIAGRNINNLRYADDTTLMTESEELKSLLMKVKEESGKS